MRLFGKRKVSLNAAPPLLQTPRLVLRGFDPSDAVDVLARAQRLMAQVKRLGQHHLPTPAAIRGVVRLVVLIECIVADIGRAHLDQPLVLRAADDAFLHDRVDHGREQRHNVDLHSSSPSMLRI